MNQVIIEAISYLTKALENLHSLGEKKKDSKETKRIRKIRPANIAEDGQDSTKIPKQIAIQKLNHIIQQFRIERARQCNPLRAMEYHDKRNYKDVRQQLYDIIVQTDGYKITRDNHNQKISECPYCTFSHQLAQVAAHLMKRHANNYYLYNCALCPKDFQSHQLLMNHIKQRHSDTHTTYPVEDDQVSVQLCVD